MKLLNSSVLLLALFMVAFVTRESRAGSPVSYTLKCSVGGKKFTYIGTASSSRWGTRPDGKPYGSWTFPDPLAVCPDNGLVMYREFSKQDVRSLRHLIATPEYQRLRNADTPYYRAYWLMGQLQEPLENQLWVLQQASWESDFQLERKAHYQREFAQRARELPRPEGKDDLTWIVTQISAANALRELEKFDEALQLLDSLDLKSLDVPVPEQKVSGTTASGHGKFIENHAEIRAAEARRSWSRHAESLRTVILRRDGSSEPIDMVPLRVASERCDQYPRTLPEYQAVCESDAMRAQRERQAKMRALMTPAAVPAPAPSESK